MNLAKIRREDARVRIECINTPLAAAYDTLIKPHTAYRLSVELQMSLRKTHQLLSKLEREGHILCFEEGGVRYWERC